MSEDAIRKMEKELPKSPRKIKLRENIWILIIITFLYGNQLFRHPQILETYSVYQYLSEHLNPYFISVVFMALSILLLIGYLTHLKPLMRVVSAFLVCLWFVFLVAFFLSPPPNSVWLLSAGMLYVSIMTARRI